MYNWKSQKVFIKTGTSTAPLPIASHQDACLITDEELMAAELKGDTRAAAKQQQGTTN